MSFLRYWQGRKHRPQLSRQKNDCSGSFVSRVMKSRADCIFLIKGKDTTNRPAWYYVLTPFWKKTSLSNLQGTGNRNLNDYGTILHSGYGEEPPDEVKALMFEKFGFAGE
ncbi:MAG: hypothetical protein ACK526_01735 [Planctomyces sp.]|jgi:hypothetical protein